MGRERETEKRRDWERKRKTERKRKGPRNRKGERKRKGERETEREQDTVRRERKGRKGGSRHVPELLAAPQGQACPVTFSALCLPLLHFLPVLLLGKGWHLNDFLILI